MEKIQPLRLEVTIPSDKSITHRAIMLAALAEGESVIEDYLPSEDCLSTLKAFMDMGIEVERTEKILKIKGKGIHGLRKPLKSIDAGNSGTTTRLLSGILAGQNFETEITGDQSLSKRPMKRIIEPLSLMNVKIEAKDDNFLPLKITGNPNLKPIRYESRISSAQVKSCVLFAGMQANGTTTFTEPVKSRDHTERMFQAAGINIKVSGNVVSVTGPSKIEPLEIVVPGDISSAAFFLVLGAIHPDAIITIKNVGINPTRDGIIQVLKEMGADIHFLKQYAVSGETVADIQVRSSKLRGINIGSAIMPRLIDEIPVIALMATQAEGTTVISGAEELRVKESDRIKAVTTQLIKMGASVEETADGMIIKGPVKLKNNVFEDHADHRIAMMIAVAQKAMGVEPEKFASVAISFPGFYSKLSEKNV